MSDEIEFIPDEEGEGPELQVKIKKQLYQFIHLKTG